MISHINSIIFEGIVDGALSVSIDDHRCEFSVVSARYHNQSGSVVVEESTMTTVTWGRLAERCIKFLSHGSRVRVIGQIKQYGSEIKILAEHVEIVPAAKDHEETER